MVTYPALTRILLISISSAFFFSGHPNLANASAAGADMNDVHVSIEGDADIVLIEGKRIRPDYIVFPKKVMKGSYVAEECVWGDFYRRIILPESVNIDKAEAKIKNGVLILILPLLKPCTRTEPSNDADSTCVASKEKHTLVTPSPCALSNFCMMQC